MSGVKEVGKEYRLIEINGILNFSDFISNELINSLGVNHIYIKEEDLNKRPDIQEFFTVSEKPVIGKKLVFKKSNAPEGVYEFIVKNIGVSLFDTVYAL